MDKIVNPVIGEEIIFLTTSKQSNGEKTIMEVTIGPKGGNPLHYHKRFSETFNVMNLLAAELRGIFHALKTA